MREGSEAQRYIHLLKERQIKSVPPDLKDQALPPGPTCQTLGVQYRLTCWPLTLLILWSWLTRPVENSGLAVPTSGQHLERGSNEG